MVSDGEPRTELINACRILDVSRPTCQRSPKGAVAVVLVAMDGDPEKVIQPSRSR